MIPPGSTIGLLGGGQLGRMFGIAARRMGYRVHALDPSLDCPAGQVADVEINRPYNDIDAARNFANRCDVVTFEFENVPAETLAEIEAITPVHPSPHVLHTTRHRLREKTFLSDEGIPHATWKAVQSPAEVVDVSAALGEGILKTALFGYDGKGQSRLAPATPLEAAEAAWQKLGAPDVAVFEQLVPFEAEVSVVIARTAAGQVQAYPVGRNDHRHGILDVTTVPSGFGDVVEQRAVEVATEVAQKLEAVGLIAVELFVVPDEHGGGGYDLLVNEIAPRTHNSGHWTFDASITSQFEQQLRAVCGLPLGAVAATAGGVAMANLLGDLWTNGEPDWEAILRMPNVKLHLYGKTEARPGRKMGYLVATAETPEAARSLVHEARRRLLNHHQSVGVGM
jgi:5-(carboxyamino)imidazole ribonucleotide synthase